MKENEQQIIFHLKQGENHAYKYIYDEYYVFLCSIAKQYVRDDFLAATIVDDLIFHLWEKRETLQIISLRSYLVRAVRNRCVNYLNQEREKRELTFSTVENDRTELTSYTDVYDYPLGKLLEMELEEKITQAIENLPDDSRTVFKMSRYEEKTYDQIAQELGISVNTVKYHIKNALQRLSRELAHYLMSIMACLLFFQ